MAEATFQRHGEPPEQPSDFGGRQIHVRQQAGGGGQQPTDPVGPVAEQGRAAQVEDGGEGDVGAEGHWSGHPPHPNSATVVSQARPAAKAVPMTNSPIRQRRHRARKSESCTGRSTR